MINATRNFSLFLLLMMAVLGLRAQNGNAVISEVKAYDLGNGVGVLTVRISGNQASNYVGGSFTISGNRIPGGAASSGLGVDTRSSVPAPSPGNGGGNTNPNGNQAVVLTAVFPLSPVVGNQPEFANVDLRVRPSTTAYTELKGNRTVPFYTVVVE